jgi:hypothetical protein
MKDSIKNGEIVLSGKKIRYAILDDGTKVISEDLGDLPKIQYRFRSNIMIGYIVSCDHVINLINETSPVEDIFKTIMNMPH